jgi:hypothetical protein
MSSQRTDRETIEAWAVLIGCATAVCWYGIRQLPYSLVFFYQLARIAFPQLVPQIEAP